MNSDLKLDDTRLLIFHEGRKRKIFVGELIYLKDKDQYEFTYDKKYTRSKRAIPIGPEFDLFKRVHKSAKGKLFASLLDRIPLKSNPAYVDYCKSQGISANEKNLIILLGAIGRRGPSSFVFEAVYKSEFSIVNVVKLRQQLQITQHDFSTAFDLKEITLQKMESGNSHDQNTLKLLQIYFEFPEVALWQLKQTGSRIHHHALSTLIQYFASKLEPKTTN